MCPPFKICRESFWSSKRLNPHLRRVADMAKAISAKMLSAEPSRHDDQLTVNVRSFENREDHVSGPSFAIIGFQRAFGQQNAPGIMSGFCELLVAFQ